MLRSQLRIAAFVAAFAMAAPLATRAAAQDRDDHARHEQRIYDSVHKDYHNWDTDEDRRFHQFMDEHHRQYKDYSRLSKKQQREYWQWRHDHERDEHR